MIGSICFGIGVAGTFIALARIVSKIQHKHYSMAYYTYVTNNGCPPPSVDDKFDYNLYIVG